MWSLPVKKTKRRYRISTFKEQERYIDPDAWYKSTKPVEGSWWPALEGWIAKHSGKKLNHSSMGAPEKGYSPFNRRTRNLR